MTEIITTDQLDNLLRRINRPIHLIAELNNQLEEIYNSSEEMEEEIAIINLDLDILKGVELIASNKNITLPAYEYFCGLAQEIISSEAIKTIQNYIEKDCSERVSINKTMTITLLERLSIIFDRMKDAVEKTKEVYDANIHLEKELVVINNQIKLSNGLKIILNCECLGREIIKNCKNSICHLEDSEALRRIEIYLVDCENQ